jgi:small conductance mechanosensitive channel
MDVLQFDRDLFAKMTTEPQAMRGLVDMFGHLAVNLVTALLILVATLWLSRFVSNLVKRSFVLGRRRRRVDVTLSNFISSVVRYLVLIVGLIAVLGQIGVQTTSILAVLGAASLAVGLALQGTLGNVAAGVMLLLLRPYRVNDFVEINGRVGTVRALDLFTTELVSPDGLKLIMPNGKVFGDMIINFNTLGTRRMELKFGIDYADDIDKALAILLRLAAEDPRILPDPEAMAVVTALTDHSVIVTLRAWTTALDLGDAESDMIKAVKETFTREGLKFPYPHQIALTRAEFVGEADAAKPASARKAAARLRADANSG